MEKFIIILFLIGFIFLGILFSKTRNQVIKDCNGEVIGKEYSGQERDIFKCKDGMQIII